MVVDVMHSTVGYDFGDLPLRSKQKQYVHATDFISAETCTDYWWHTAKIASVLKKSHIRY